MSGVFRTIDPPPPLHPASVSWPRTKGGRGGGYTLAGRWGGGRSIFRKTPGIGLASYSIIPLRSTVSVCTGRSGWWGNHTWRPQASYQPPIMHITSLRSCTAPAFSHAQHQPPVMHISPPVMHRNGLNGAMHGTNLRSCFCHACYMPVAWLWKVPASDHAMNHIQVILWASLQLCHGPASVHGVMHQPLVMQWSSLLSCNIPSYGHAIKQLLFTLKARLCSCNVPSSGHAMGQLLFIFKPRLCSCNVPSSGHAIGQIPLLLTRFWSCIIPSSGHAMGQFLLLLTRMWSCIGPDISMLNSRRCVVNLIQLHLFSL